MSKTLPELMALAGAWADAAGSTGFDSKDERPYCTALESAPSKCGRDGPPGTIMEAKANRLAKRVINNAR